MSLLLQISDTHFGTEQPRVVEALVALAQALQPDLVVLSGDITQRARRSEFASARRFMARLDGPPTLVLPGNHDIPLFNLVARVVNPYGNHRRSFGTPLAPVIETPECLVIGVNTTRPWRHKDGEVSADQIEHVSQRLRVAPPEQLRIVVTHQPLHVPDQRDAHNLLHGHEAAARAWAAAGADVVMGGHIHRPYVRSVRDRFPDLLRELWCVQAGTAVSSRIRQEAPNSVNVLQYDARQRPSQCEVTRWDYAAGVDEGFKPVESTTITLDRAGLPSTREEP
ncbi:metallophosphoesterase family protein [Polycyclovorans algicola]|uniref:metallophosphoesterase family protein n=1 Tax=Polycyclovorans algicola TaxID=616992 RepID=UPI0004A6CA8F|nr:metallophosphoesterase [Polycyclovorans algicola]